LTCESLLLACRPFSFNITRNWIWYEYKYGRHMWEFQYSKVNTIDVYSKIPLLTDASLANLITEHNEQVCSLFRKWRLLLLLAASKSIASVLALRSAQTPVQAVYKRIESEAEILSSSTAEVWNLWRCTSLANTK